MSYLQQPTPEDLPQLRRQRNAIWMQLRQIDEQIEALESARSNQRQQQIHAFLNEREERQRLLQEQPKEQSNA